MKIYDQLWAEAATAFEQGTPQFDLHLLNKAQDQRRGLSLMIGLPSAVQARIKAFLDQLAAEFPGQYYYRPEELHVTVVTLIPASVSWREEYRDLDAFRGILSDVLRRHRPFKLRFRGVTAARNAVMVQGFTADETLENIRGDLRHTFVERGFPNRLDRRYPNAAAHVTAMRLCRAGADWKRLVEVLKASRQTDFGEMQVNSIQLALGDWYASTETLQLIQEYSL